MSEQIRSGDIVRFECTDNPYRVKLELNGWVRFMPIAGKEVGRGWKVKSATFDRMVRDAVITREVSDEREATDGGRDTGIL